MEGILIKAGCYIAIIAMGIILRRVGFFKAEDFSVLSRIAICITLPAAVITSFVGKEIDLTLLGLSIVSFGAGVIYMIAGAAVNKSREDKAFAIINTSGYNIGNFTLPFIQSFLGPAGVVTTSLFDAGNACICLGGAHSVATLVKDGSRFDFGRLLKALLTSTTFMTYLLMVTLSVLKITLPDFVVECAGIIGAANPFVAMLMIGVGFRLEANREQLGKVARILLPRYSIALVLALLCWNFLPFDHLVRTTVVILLFSPITSAGPAYTGELGGDVGLSAAVNSISILCSISIIVGLLLVLV